MMSACTYLIYLHDERVHYVASAHRGAGPVERGHPGLGFGFLVCVAFYQRHHHLVFVCGVRFNKLSRSTCCHDFDA